MNKWTIRARVTAAFSLVIAIIIALGVMSYVRLQAIRTEAFLLESDVLPGVLISGEIGTTARNLLPAVLTRASSPDAAAKVRAETAINRGLADLARSEGQYAKAITTNDDRQLFTTLGTTQEQFAQAYQKAIRDDVLTQTEVNAELRPPLERLARLSDSLVAMNRADGE